MPAGNTKLAARLRERITTETARHIYRCRTYVASYLPFSLSLSLSRRVCDKSECQNLLHPSQQKLREPQYIYMNSHIDTSVARIEIQHLWNGLSFFSFNHARTLATSSLWISLSGQLQTVAQQQQQQQQQLDSSLLLQLSIASSIIQSLAAGLGHLHFSTSPHLHIDIDIVCLQFFFLCISNESERGSHKQTTCEWQL